MARCRVTVGVMSSTRMIPTSSRSRAGIISPLHFSSGRRGPLEIVDQSALGLIYADVLEVVSTASDLSWS
jgi:hypothetical protein